MWSSSSPTVSGWPPRSWPVTRPATWPSFVQSARSFQRCVSRPPSLPWVRWTSRSATRSGLRTASPPASFQARTGRWWTCASKRSTHGSCCRRGCRAPLRAPGAFEGLPARRHRAHAAGRPPADLLHRACQRAADLHSRDRARHDEPSARPRRRQSATVRPPAPRHRRIAATAGHPGRRPWRRAVPAHSRACRGDSRSRPHRTPWGRHWRRLDRSRSLRRRFGSWAGRWP